MGNRIMSRNNQVWFKHVKELDGYFFAETKRPMHPAISFWYFQLNVADINEQRQTAIVCGVGKTFYCSRELTFFVKGYVLRNKLILVKSHFDEHMDPLNALLYETKLGDTTKMTLQSNESCGTAFKLCSLS